MSEATPGGTVHPAFATRLYHFEPEAGGFFDKVIRLVKKPVVEDVQEQIFLPDSLNALVITPQRNIPEDVPDSVRTRAFRLVPFFTDGRRSDYYDIRVDTDSGALLVARRNHMTRKDEMDHPVWLAIWSPAGRAARDTTITTVDSSGTAQPMLAPATLHLTEAAPIAFAVADTPEDAVRIARYAVQNQEALLQQKQARMQRLLERSYVATQDGRFNHAFAWARLHMDALIMNQRGKGIFAGLPWFNNYWGRDTFISLPALWATGEWEEAREILLSFSERQNRRPPELRPCRASSTWCW